MTIQEIYEAWFPVKAFQVKESTLSTYMMCYRGMIKPTFGNKDYAEIKMADLQDFITQQIQDGKSRKTITDAMIIIKMLLCWAQEEYDLPPVPGRRKLIYPSENASVGKKLDTYSIAEQKKLIEYCKENTTLETISIMLALTTGLRIGELCGLQFGDFDFENKTLTINRCVERIYNMKNEGPRTKITIGTPKTISSHRVVPVQPYLLKMIKKYAAIYKPHFFLCSGKANPMEPRVLRSHFNAVCNEAGVRRIKFHGLRHTFATTLLENKVDIKTTSEILGHSDVSITMNTYMHPSDEMKRNAVKSLNKLFD